MTFRTAQKHALVRALIIAGVLFATLYFFVWREPRHKGKPVSYWVDLACATGEIKYCEELRAIGPRAVPYLVTKMEEGAVRKEDFSLQIRVHNWFPKLPRTFFKRFDAARSERHQAGLQAAGLLSIFGSEAKPAVPNLIKLISKQTGLEGGVIIALGAIGPAATNALPALHAALPRQLPVNQVWAADAIWRIGRETNFVLGICSQALTAGSDDMAAANAANLVQTLGPAAQPLIPMLIQLLQDTNRSGAARGNTAEALVSLGGKNESVVAALKSGTADPALGVRFRCHRSLWRLDRQYAPLAIPVYVDYLIDFKARFPTGKQSFSYHLKHFHLDPNDALPALRELLKSDNAAVRETAAELLKELAIPVVSPSVPKLK